MYSKLIGRWLVSSYAFFKQLKALMYEQDEIIKAASTVLAKSLLFTQVNPTQLIASASMSPRSEGQELSAGK